MSTTFGVIFDFHLNVIDVLMRWFDLDLPSIDDFDVTSRHVTSHPQTSPRIDVVDTSSRHEHRSQSRHRKQMLCQNVNKLVMENEPSGSNINMHKNKV